MENIEDKIRRTIKLHMELHGKNGIVDFAIVNDVLRNTEYTPDYKILVEHIVAELLDEILDEFKR